MVYEKKNISMSDGKVNAFHCWTPDSPDDIRAVMLLSHGMAEYAERYAPFAGKLVSEGIALFAEDHRGHGETAAMAEKEGTGMFGYLDDRDGFRRVVEDIHEEILLLRGIYPGKKLVLFGHSFGSFVAQCVIELYGAILDGCILCGTAGPRPLTVGFARVVGNLVCAFGGKKRKSNLISSLSFGPYNARIRNPSTEFDWLSRDPEQVARYINHPWCGFVCTGEFYRDLFRGLGLIHRKKMIASIPKDLPVLFIDGTGDPVGGYGKTVSALRDIYVKNGVKDVEIRLYEDARHELLNETNRDEVASDVLKWVSDRFLACLDEPLPEH